ncbi:hypothetical protein FNV43_RR04234 [Rhamnella rubrinervis]|uniref:Uncharacterized protein n=1 Tax=Rhamnella rubrinervis TaxID=2594499 RepID=A0A8K0HLI0_9ROSA|nr:hypothetical protein FNV43_RR04234 [Rhamnella rubrinervis]
MFLRTKAVVDNAESDNGADVSRHYDFDLFTIGAGSGGVRAFRFAANFGASVAICELPFSTISSETTSGIGRTMVVLDDRPSARFMDFKTKNIIMIEIPNFVKCLAAILMRIREPKTMAFIFASEKMVSAISYLVVDLFCHL